MKWTQPEASMLGISSRLTERRVVGGTTATSTSAWDAHGKALIAGTAVTGVVVITVAAVIQATVTTFVGVAKAANLHSCTGTRTSDMVRIAA